MSEQENMTRQPVNGTRACKLSSCRIPFEPKKSNQEFCCPDHKIEYHCAAYKKGEALMASKGIHAARVENSPRLQRVYDLMKDGKPRTTRQIIKEADVCAVNSIFSELEANGIKYKCNRIGRGVYQYQLLGGSNETVS